MAIIIGISTVMWNLITFSNAQSTPGGPATVLERTIEDMAQARKAWLRHEIRASDMTVFPTNIYQGRDRLGDFASRTTEATYTLTAPFPTGFALQAGFTGLWHRLFAPGAAALPSDLYALSLNTALLFQPNREWRFLLQLRPGLYSDFHDISWSDFNIPVLLGGEYVVSETFTLIFGLSLDLQREFPVIPGIGFHWKFADGWTLEFIAPKPRVLWQVTDTISAYFFGEYRGGSFRVSETFGSGYGRPELNNTIINLREFNTGLGGEMKLSRGVTAFAEAGVTISRLWLYDREGLQYASDPGPFFRAGVRLSF